MIRAEIAALDQRAAEVLTDLDETDQTAAMLDRGPGVDSTIRLYHRYRKDAEGKRAEALDELRQAQREAAAAKKAEEKAKPATEFEAMLRLIGGPGRRHATCPVARPSARRRWWRRPRPWSNHSSTHTRGRTGGRRGAGGCHRPGTRER